MDFHMKLVEDSIRYVFNILTNPDMPFSELHEFYFKMLYFYDRLELIIFANHLEGTDLIKNYSKFITESKIEMGFHKTTAKTKKTRPHKHKVLKEDHKYNAFLMSSLSKSSEIREFNLDRINNFIGKTRSSKGSSKSTHSLVEDMSMTKILKSTKRESIHKVFSNMLPVGHFLTEFIESASSNISIPKLYSPEDDADVSGKYINPWNAANEFVQHYEPVNIVENNIIIGYYEKHPNSIEIKFKLRSPIQKIEKKDDQRAIERGAACSTRKKEDLHQVAKSIKVSFKDKSIKDLCTDIKLELMGRELKERRKFKHMSAAERKTKKRIKWFYLHFESHSLSK
jgi:hypothetical protein